jgi:polygalacturonase
VGHYSWHATCSPSPGQNITVTRCSFNGTQAAVRVKTDSGSTGYLRDVTYSDLEVGKGVSSPAQGASFILLFS